VSILHDAGDGRFDDELDLMDIVDVTDVLGEAQRAPGERFQFPGPDRNPSPPRLATP